MTVLRSLRRPTGMFQGVPAGGSRGIRSAYPSDAFMVPTTKLLNGDSKRDNSGFRCVCGRTGWMRKEWWPLRISEVLEESGVLAGGIRIPKGFPEYLCGDGLCRGKFPAGRRWAVWGVVEGAVWERGVAPRECREGAPKIAERNQPRRTRNVFPSTLGCRRWQQPAESLRRSPVRPPTCDEWALGDASSRRPLRQQLTDCCWVGGGMEGRGTLHLASSAQQSACSSWASNRAGNCHCATLPLPLASAVRGFGTPARELRGTWRLISRPKVRVLSGPVKYNAVCWMRDWVFSLRLRKCGAQSRLDLRAEEWLVRTPRRRGGSWNLPAHQRAYLVHARDSPSCPANSSIPSLHSFEVT